MTDKEKIARAVGMMDLAKAICMQKQNVNDAVRVSQVLQTTVDAVLNALKDDDE